MHLCPFLNPYESNAYQWGPSAAGPWSWGFQVRPCPRVLIKLAQGLISELTQHIKPCRNSSFMRAIVSWKGFGTLIFQLKPNFIVTKTNAISQSISLWDADGTATATLAGPTALSSRLACRGRAAESLKNSFSQSPDIWQLIEISTV